MYVNSLCVIKFEVVVFIIDKWSTYSLSKTRQSTPSGSAAVILAVRMPSLKKTIQLYTWIFVSFQVTDTFLSYHNNNIDDIFSRVCFEAFCFIKQYCYNNYLLFFSYLRLSVKHTCILTNIKNIVRQNRLVTCTNKKQFSYVRQWVCLWNEIIHCFMNDK